MILLNSINVDRYLLSKDAIVLDENEVKHVSFFSIFAKLKVSMVHLTAMQSLNNWVYP